MEAENNLHPVASTHTYVDVLLPIAIPKTYTYFVPEEFISGIQFGQRVEVQFGKNKRYAALIVNIHQQAPEAYQPKAILSIIDADAVIHPPQWSFWQWLSSYYLCTAGEVMNAALPANLKLASETRIVLSPLFQEDMQGLSDKEFLIAEALTIQQELSLNDVRDILQQKTVYPVIHQMIEKKIIYLKEEMKEKFKPRKISCVRLQEPYASQPKLLEEAFELAARAPKQTEALLAFVQLSRKQEFIRRQDIIKMSGVDHAPLKALEKKGIFELYEREISRLPAGEEETSDTQPFSEGQTRVSEEISLAWEKNSAVLLHGVTGSGKTRIYIEKIQEVIQSGGQALYLLPEIALTTQLINRLKRIFGNEIAVYHSRLNNNERVELWRNVHRGHPLIMGARSSLLLPFADLQLIIVDEEHDTSYKQQDPAPRYNARDAAVYLGHLHGAKVLLGSATPSLESFYNAKKQKYGLVSLSERFGGVQMPNIQIADIRRALAQQEMHSHFTQQLLDAMRQALEQEEQIILFQNRRGYAPTIRCMSCGWTQQCIHCDVTLTYHKFQHQLQCHYCGYRSGLPKSCPACGHTDLRLQGFGTEKIEDELKIFFPEATIARMDFDTVRSKNAHARIINDFEEGRIDILVGTQMVTKGLDFENVGVVGVLSADHLLQFPDFRASERGFQLMTQVAGRAGRKQKQGKVVIQAMNMAHPVIEEVLKHDYPAFYAREITERQQFSYPPYSRLIKLTLKHKKPAIVNEAGKFMEAYLNPKLGKRIVGPAVPYVGRVRGQYLLDFLIKLERDNQLLAQTKALIADGIAALQKHEGCTTVRVNVDVDPY